VDARDNPRIKAGEGMTARSPFNLNGTRFSENRTPQDPLTIEPEGRRSASCRPELSAGEPRSLSSSPDFDP
jgi:hypothetical protein